MAISYGTYTITDIQEGSQIWTTSVAPTTPNYTFTISNLTGDSDASVKVGDIIMYDSYRYTVSNINSDGTTVLTGDRTSIKGDTGASATTYHLITSTLAIVKGRDNSLSPSSIVLTAKSQSGSNAMTNYSGRFKIETTTDNSTWTTKYTSSGNEATKTYTLPTGIVAVRCSLYLAGGTSTLLDQQTVPVVSDGTNGTSVSITSTSVTYQSGTSGTTKPTGSWQTTVPSVSQGNYLWTKTIVNYSDGSSTESYSVARQGNNGSNGTNGSSVSITSTSITYQSGTSGTSKPTGTWQTTIPSVAQGNYLWTKTVVNYNDGTSTESYSAARQGSNGTNGIDGKDAYTVSLSNDNHTFAGDTTKAIQADVDCSVIGFKGATQVAVTIGTITGQPTGMTTSITNNGTTNTYFTVSVTTAMTTRNGVLTIPVTIDGKSFTKKFTYSLALKGDKGDKGDSGGIWYSGTAITGTSTTATIFSNSGITSAVVGDMYLNTTTYNTYRCTVAGNASTAKWVYVNNIKGGKGDVGNTGKGISSIKNQYYLSTSNTTQVDGGSWTDTVPTYISGRYYWTRSYIVWSDNTNTTTNPVLDNALTSANSTAKQAKDIADNTAQYFWVSSDTTDSGVHITEVPQADFVADRENGGGNLLARSNGIVVRDGLDELAKFGSDGVVIGKTDESNVEINNNSMIMSVNENPIIQLRVNDEVMSTQKGAGSYLLDTNNTGASTVVIDNSKYSDFSNCSSIKCTVWIGKEFSVKGRTNTFTFGTSKTIAYIVGSSEASCKVFYDGEYTFEVTDCVNNSTEYPRMFLEIRYIVEKNTASVILGATDQTEYYSYTVTEGYNCHATAKYSHAEGYETQTSFDKTTSSYVFAANHAEGYRTIASGDAAHAEGFSVIYGDTTASGKGSHAEGCNTKATAYASHSEGGGTEANGRYSHAEGNGTTANGINSHSSGYGTYADKQSQMVIGEWNIRDTYIESSNPDKGKYVFIIGNGTSNSARSNALTVNWNGNVQMYLDTINVELDNSILTAIQSLGWDDDVID